MVSDILLCHMGHKETMTEKQLMCSLVMSDMMIFLFIENRCYFSLVVLFLEFSSSYSY